MKTPLLLAVLALPLAAASASAEDNPRVVYQNSLLARALSPEDAQLCDERVGARTGENATAYDQCKVTRLFVSDLKQKKPTPGVPPMLKGAYLNKIEIALVADAIKPK